jgi:8-oxo-dGTP pyrophosphatase MutT (NUDIX family)
MAAPLPSRGNLPDNARPLVARTPRPPKPSTNGHANGQASPPNVKSHDPARGIKGAPPGFGMPVMPHVMTFQGLISNLAKVYRNPDEAYRHSKDNARYMRNDCTVMECLEARQRCVALLNWHLEAEDENSPLQKKLVDDLTAIIRRTSRFVEYRRSLQEAVWFGRSAINNLFNWDYVHGQQRLIVRKWRPINGDKLLFRQDIPGVNEEGWDPDQIGIRVAGNFKPGDLVGPHKVVATDQGMGYFLEDWERRAIVLHKHMVEDAAYESPIDAGAIHGVGVRSRIYWAWYQKQEALAMLVEYLERVGQGFTIWYYPLGNPEGKEKAEAAAMESHQNNNILVPIPEGEEKSQYGIDRIEPNAAGVESLKSIVHDLFGHQIKRYILGQILSSESEATGLGSGVADLHLETFNQIIRYDATNLEESLTTDFVEPLKLFNFPGSQRVYVRFVIDTESPEVEKKLQAYQMAWEMGLKLKPAEVAGMIGSSIPTDGEEALQNPTFSQGAGMGLGLPGMPGQQPGQPGQPGDNLPGSRSTVAFPQNPLAGGDDDEGPGEDGPEVDDDPDDDPDKPDDDGPEGDKQKAAAADGGLQLRMYGPAGGATPRQYAKRDDAESIIVEDDDPDIVATAIIHDGKVLLVRRSEASTRTGEWECPAGHRRDGEDPRKAAAREVEEETGLSIEFLPGEVPFETRNGKSGVMYRAQVAAGSSSNVDTNPKEHDYHWWLSLDSLAKLDDATTPPDLRQQIEKLAEDLPEKLKHRRNKEGRRVYRAEPDPEPKGAQWKTVGGAPALVGEDGHIHAGCPGLEGEDVDDLRDESDESRARRARKQDAHEDHRDSVLREAHDRALEMAPAGTILLVNENGDYHAFGAGAARLNEHLELGNGKHAVIKQADLEGHLNTLVNRGHRVGIVDAPGHATPHREDDDHEGYPDAWDDIDMVGDEEPTPQEQPETGEQMESPVETEIDAPTQPDPAKADAARRARAELEQSKEAIRRAWRQAGQNPPDELLPKQEASVRELESAAGLPPGGEPKSQPQSQQQPAKQPKPKRTSEGRLGQAISALAEEHNLDAATLRDAVDFVWEEKRQAITDREHAKMQLREIMGLTRNDFARLSNAGKDYTAIPGFDVKATSVAASLPELGLGNHAEGYSEDLGERVWDMLGEGRIEPPARWSNEVLSEAVDLAHQAGKYVPARDDAIESVPFARTRRFLRKYARQTRLFDDDPQANSGTQKGLDFESKHPRDDEGKFVEKESAGSGSSSSESSSTPAAAAKESTADDSAESELHAARESVRAKLLKDMPEQLKRLSKDKQQAYRAAISRAIDGMNGECLRRVDRFVSSVQWKPSVSGVTAEARRRGSRIPRGATVMGFFAYPIYRSTGKPTHEDLNGTLCLDGGEDTGERVGTADPGSDITAAGTHAHELAHAIGGHDFDYTPEWKKNWQEEINLPSTPLSKYAKTDAQEGWAEFGRLLFLDREKAEANYPKCFQYWRDKGLV